MANWKSTHRANLVVSLIKAGVTEGGGWDGNTSDPHPPVGNEQATTRIARVELRFPEPNWPSKGRLVSASLTLSESGTSSHGNYKGNNSRAEIRRVIDTKLDGNSPSNTASSDTVTFFFNGSETHSVYAMVEEMLPSHIKRKSDPDAGGGNRPYGKFQIRSSDETDYQHSFIMTDDCYLTVTIKDDVTPDAPDILEVIGVQDGPSDPSIVASADGQTLQVRWAFVGGSGDTPSKAELAFMLPGATDALPGTTQKTTGSVTPTAGGAAGVYISTLSGLGVGASGRFHIRATSQKGEQGDWSTLDDDESYVQLAVLPGPPLDIVFQPFASNPHILFSLNSADPTDYITHADAEVTYIPQGTEAVTLDQQIGGTTRRADLSTGVDFTPGQRVSFRVRLTNRDGVVGQWSAPQVQTVQEAQAVTFSPAPGRLASLTPTITLTFPLADGARLRLLDPVDDTKVVYDSGATVLVNQTSRAFVIPAGKLAYGQSYRAYGSYVPDGGGTTYLAESEPITYSVASLATTTLQVPDAVARKVDTTNPVWLRTVTDPDGAAIASIEQEIRVAATPQGGGSLVVDHVDTTATALRTIPGGTFAFETAVDARARAKNDTGAFGPWSSWLTITALQPPTVDLVLPADFATIASPFATLSWSVGGFGSRTQASAVATIYTDTGDVLASLLIDDDTATTDIPAYLLDDLTDYLWDVTVTDTGGMATTSAQQTFTTAFTDPLPIVILTAIGDPQNCTVDLSWDASAEPYLHHYEVTWYADDGSPVRIDGGPESLLDGNDPFTGISLVHIGARLGDNTYSLAVSNGNIASDPVSTMTTLTPPDFRAWCLTDGNGDSTGLVVTSESKAHAGQIERFQPPGGRPRQVTWGSEARRLPLTVELVPSEDGELVSVLRGWMAAGTPVWVKGPAPYLEDPLWATLQGFTSTPLSWGGMTIDLDWLELGDPVYAVLPAVLDPEPGLEPDIVPTDDDFDFGDFGVP